jgi:L,D-transpeptidase catalytic domain
VSTFTAFALLRFRMEIGMLAADAGCVRVSRPVGEFTMRIIRQAGLALLALFALGATANATVHVHIDLSSQRMHVTSSSGSYDWAVSTARSGYSTPRGSYAPTSLQRMHYSRKYHMSPMPHSIFFRGGYAIHGTYATGALGRPASHGCVRLAPGNAAALYAMVKAEGARISISGSPPRGGSMVARGHRHSASRVAARRVQQSPMAYAPYGYAPTVQQWQYNPWQR